MSKGEKKPITSGEENVHEKAREALGGQEGIDSLRERLYERGATAEKMGRSTLESTPKKVSKTWSEPSKEAETPPKKAERSYSDIVSPVTKAANAAAEAFQQAAKPVAEKIRPQEKQEPDMPRTKKTKGYRTKLIIGGLVFFAFALGLSSVLLLSGGQTISGENISIDISDDQFTIGGGEELLLQIAVANQNSIPIESATLIVNYPSGTQSAQNPGQEIFSERLQLNSIESGEVINVPVKAIIFGEENEEKTITAAVEYRVRGSNATFFKEAEPLRLKISSSPIVLLVDAVESITSGQEMEFELTVKSNSPTPLSDILVKATYPFGFDFTDSDVETASGQDTWLIETLDPEAETTIVIRGVVTGKENEDRVFIFSAGVPNERDRFSMASVFSRISTEVRIEQPFLDIAVDVNGDPGESVVISPDEVSQVNVVFTNTLDATLYDLVITAELEGAALNEIKVNPSNGFYNSNTNIVTWDSVDGHVLGEVAPGQSDVVQLNLFPEKGVPRTPEISMVITVRGTRVFEDRVPQEIEGTVSRTFRIASLVELETAALYTTGSFTNTGPIPPVAEKITQYTLSMEVKNGSNDVTNAEVTAVLPSYVTWLDLKTPGDVVTYDSVTRTLTWSIGDMDANAREEMALQVSFLPSLSQVGTTPTILETQRFKATDRFTGTIVRTTAPALTTSLLNDPDEDTHNGRVQEE